jgi:hypothetical protein
MNEYGRWLYATIYHKITANHSYAGNKGIKVNVHLPTEWKIKCHYRPVNNFVHQCSGTAGNLDRDCNREILDTEPVCCAIALADSISIPSSRQLMIFVFWTVHLTDIYTPGSNKGLGK